MDDIQKPETKTTYIWNFAYLKYGKTTNNFSYHFIRNKKTRLSGKKLKKNKLFLLAATVLVLVLLSSSTSVSAVGAGVNVTPDTIGLGDPISISIEPYTDLNALVLVAGPLAEDLTTLPDFHAHLASVASDEILSLLDGVEYTLIYPTSGVTGGLSYTWVNPLDTTGANTDLPGWYAVIVLLSDGPMDLDDLLAALADVISDGDFSPLMEYLLANYDTFLQFTVARVFAVPEIPFGTAAAIASPLLVLGCLKIIKRRRRG